MDTLEMIFSQHKETCEVLIDYPKIGGGDIKDYVRKAIIYLLHANIDVHSRRLVDESPLYGVKFIPKLQYHCANMTFSGKSRYYWLFKQVTHNRGGSVMNYINKFKDTKAL